MSTTPDLKTAVEALYNEFQSPKPRHIDRCPCCGNGKVVKNPHKDLHDLTSDDLGTYSIALFATVGGVADFKYYLPRMFELAAMDADWYTAPCTMLSHLKRGEWRRWPPSEQAAVDTFLKAWFASTLDQEPTYYPQQRVMGETEALLSAFAGAGIDLSPYFEMLMGAPNALLQLYSENEDVIDGRAELCEYPWADTPVASTAFLVFLRSPEVQASVWG